MSSCYQDLPFSSRETVAGRVVRLKPRYALLEIRQQMVPIDTAMISWNALRSPADLLSIGDRLEVVVFLNEDIDDLHRQYLLMPRITNLGLWASRLPLLGDPWQQLRSAYPEGSVVEVEVIDYLNWYIARVRMPTGLIIEVRTNDIHPRMSKHPDFFRKLRLGERIKVVFRKCYQRGVWIERFAGGSTDDHLAQAGYITPSQANLRLNRRERAFLASRNTTHLEA